MLIGVVAATSRPTSAFFSFGDGFGFFSQPFAAEGWLAVFGFLGMGAIGFFRRLRQVRPQAEQGSLQAVEVLRPAGSCRLFAWGAVAAGVSTELSVPARPALTLGRGSTACSCC